MSNSVEPDETAHYEPSHLDLRCLQTLSSSPMAVKELKRWSRYKHANSKDLGQNSLRTACSFFALFMKL